VSGCGGILNDDTLHGISRALRDNEPLRGSIHRALNLCTLVTRSDLDPVSGSRPPGCMRSPKDRFGERWRASCRSTKRRRSGRSARCISFNAEYALLAPTGRFIVETEIGKESREKFMRRVKFTRVGIYRRERALFLTNKPVARLVLGSSHGPT